MKLSEDDSEKNPLLDISETSRNADTLSIFHAAFWLSSNSDPIAHEYLLEYDDKYAEYWAGRPDLQEEIVINYLPLILKAIKAGKINYAGAVVPNTNEQVDCYQTHIHMADWLAWCAESQSYQHIAESFGRTLSEGKQTVESTSDDHAETLPDGITSKDLGAFFGGYMGVENPFAVLSKPPKWALKNNARRQRGRRGRPTEEHPDTSLWDPVQFALNLLERKPRPLVLTTHRRLHADDIETLFHSETLQPWFEQWKSRRPSK